MIPRSELPKYVLDREGKQRGTVTGGQRLCSRSGTICEIEYLEDDVARLTMTDGWHAEVLLNELS